ncbi:gliding motility protein GldN [Mucilaginibacter sp. PPCGB 2223]|uniref:type IX secretion system ring protein PorN/GldN n=1 Tax=Mucilaginibacter sp. PPCGB 2223 TaxID=1886027 RepID=UPI0009F51FC1|nr:gliding motility protein GldN [Mucilaginibacter sp. PPCGB 2223]
MKKRILIVLCIMLVASLSTMAQSKKRSKTKTPAKRTTKVVKPKTDTTAIAAKKDSTPVVVQNTPNKVVSVPDSDDGYLKSEIMTKARPFPIPDPNPNNIKYYHRYWRDIDLKDPRNQKFNTPGATLIEALLKGIKDGRINAYDATGGIPENPGGDAFTVPMSYDNLMGRMRDTATIDKLDKDGNKIGSERKLNDFSPDKVVGYRIKEDVYFDKRLSRVQTRIIGIAPLIRVTLTNGDTIGTQPVCWLKYKQCRLVFATMDVSDPDKNLYDVSMDDMFLQRQFYAKIVEESNPLGRRIKDYMKDPADQDKEAQRIEKKLADYKANAWAYTTTGALDGSEAAANAKSGKKQAAPKKAANTPPQPTPSTGAPVKQ